MAAESELQAGESINNLCAIEGTIRKKDEKRMWIYKAQEKRADNLICAAVVEDDGLIVKTVMINWQLVG